MKRQQLLIILCLGVWIPMQARIIDMNKHPFTLSGITYGYSGARQYTGVAQVVQYLKDTTIQGDLAQKLRLTYSSHDITSNDPYTIIGSYDLYFKYANDTLWMWEELDQSFVMFLRFNLQIGDSIPYVVPKKLCHCTGGTRWAKVVQIVEKVKEPHGDCQDTLLITEYELQEDTTMPLSRSYALGLYDNTNTYNPNNAKYTIRNKVGFVNGFFPVPTLLGQGDAFSEKGIYNNIFSRYCQKGEDSSKLSPRFGVTTQFTSANRFTSYQTDSFYSCRASYASSIKKYLTYEHLVDGEDKAPNIDIYPNPAHTAIYVTLPTGLDYQIKVYDVLGRTVHSSQVSKEQARLQKIDITHLPKGLHILKLGSNTHTVTKKFVKR